MIPTRCIDPVVRYCQGCRYGRDMCDIDEVEFNQDYDLEYYIYLGA